MNPGERMRVGFFLSFSDQVEVYYGPMSLPGGGYALGAKGFFEILGPTYDPQLSLPACAPPQIGQTDDYPKITIESGCVDS